MSYSTSGPIETILRKEDTVDPVAGNDNTQGYAIKSRWINTSSNEEWVCTDASTGAALWELTTGGDGDVVGPASATNRGLVLWDGTTGKLVKDMPNISVGGLQAATLAISAGVGRAVAMLEQASGVTTASAGYGKFWVQNDAPNTPMFTDDAGTEKALTFTEGAISDTAVPRIRTDGHLETSSDLTLTGGQVRLSNISTASLRIRDSAAAPATITGYGYHWVRDDVPTVPMFTDDVGTDLRLGGAFTHSIAGGVVPANTTNWYGPNNYYTYYQGTNWTLAYGTGTDPAPAVYSMYPVAPRAGIIRDVQLWVRGSNTAIAGEVALYKFAQTDGSGTLTATKLNSAGISIPTISSTSQRYDASTTFTTANTVAAGDMISPFIKFSAGATNTLMFTLTYVMEYT